MSDVSITNAVGKRVRQLRTARNLSQESLALSAGISTNYLGQVERGVKTPTVETIYKICGALDIALPEFFILEDIDDEGKHSLAYHSILESLKDLPADSAIRISLIIKEIAALNQSNRK